MSVGLGWSAESVRQFDELCAPLSNWGRWGDEDERGTINLLTAERAAAAAALVRSGRVVALGRQWRTTPAPDNIDPPLHLMKSSGDSAPELGGSHASDWLGFSYHGLAITHVDALSHQFWNGRMYNGRPATAVSTRSGAASGSVEVLGGGLVGRGILLDMPRALDREWIEPGEALSPADLDRAAAAQQVQLAAGDIVLVRVGRDARARAHGRIDPMTGGAAGLAAQCLHWLREHDVAVLGGDGQNDVMPPGGAPFLMPIHAGALAVLGLPLLDNLALEELGQACAEAGRWEFMLTIAPLRLPRATGSPVNPLAVL